jgi:hypothetical protein
MADFLMSDFCSFKKYSWLKSVLMLGKKIKAI